MVMTNPRRGNKAFRSQFERKPIFLFSPFDVMYCRYQGSPIESIN